MNFIEFQGPTVYLSDQRVWLSFGVGLMKLNQLAVFVGGSPLVFSTKERSSAGETGKNTPRGVRAERLRVTWAWLKRME